MSDQELATSYDELDTWDEKPQESQFIKMKEIRFCGGLSKKALQEGIPQGNFFLFDPNVPQGEDPILTDLGKSVNVNVIRDTKRLEVYEDYSGTDQFTITSSEFRSNDDLIFLYDKTVTDGSNEIVALLPYINFQDETKCIKHLKDTRYGKRLRTKYLAYCLWHKDDGDPEVVQIGFTATDNTGCEHDQFKPRGFKDYAADSFLGVKSAGNKVVKNKLFVHNIELFSKPAHKVTVQGEERDSLDCIKGFRITDQIDDERKVLVQDALKFVKDFLEAKYAAKSLRAYANTLDKENIVTLDERHIPLMIGTPSMLMGYEQIPFVNDETEIPKLDLPESDRERSEKKDALPFDEDKSKAVEPEVVDAEVVEPAKAKPVRNLFEEDEKPKPKNKKEAMAQKREESKEIAESELVDQAVKDAEKVHEDTVDAQKEKLKEVDAVFGTGESKE